MRNPLAFFACLLLPFAPLAWIVCDGQTGTVHPSSTQPTPSPTPAPIGFQAFVWYQPISSFATWKGRGITALYGWDQGSGTVDQYCAAANAAGLKYALQIYQLQPNGLPVLPLAISPAVLAHDRDPGLVGWVFPDEPNGVGNLTAAQIAGLYSLCRAASPRTPCILNLDGGHVLQFGQAGCAGYLAACDVVSFDHYPANYGSLDWPNMQTIAADLHQWSGGKPVMAIMECGDMNICVQAWCAGTPLAALMRSPTATEMARGAKLATAGGATMICWFPDRIGQGWEAYDDTTLDTQGSMAAINMLLAH